MIQKVNVFKTKYGTTHNTREEAEREELLQHTIGQCLLIGGKSLHEPTVKTVVTAMIKAGWRTPPKPRAKRKKSGENIVVIQPVEKEK